MADIEECAIVLGGDGCDLDDIECECGVAYYQSCDVCDSVEQWMRWIDTRGASGVPQGCWKCGDSFGPEISYEDACELAEAGTRFFVIHSSAYDVAESSGGSDDDEENDEPWRARAGV